MRSLEEIISELNTVKNQMYDEAVKLKDIDDKSGEAVLASIASAGLQSLGIPVALPKELGFAALGVFGIALSIRKQNKIKPVAQRLKELEKQYNELVNEYEAAVLTEQAKTLKNPITSDSLIAFTEKINQTNQRSTNNQTSTLTWSIIALLFFLAAFYYFKKKRKHYE